MTKLCFSCAIVGVVGSSFSVDIDADQTVGDLKEAIKEEMYKLKNVDADDLVLFLGVAAKYASYCATWKQGEHSRVLKENNLPDPQTTQIHVLVVVPDGRKRFQSDLWFAESSQPLKKHRVSDDVDEKASKDAGEDESKNESEDESEERTFFEMRGFPPVAHPVMKHRKIMERKAYVVIFAQLVQHVKACFESGPGDNCEPGKDSNVVVTGNPGIGKSRFYLYCIFQLIRNQEREDIKQLPPYELVLNYEAEFLKYDAASAGFVQLNKVDVRALKYEPRVLRLIEARSTQLMGWHGVSVLFAPPDVEGLHDFEKVNGPKFIMPTWSFEELKEYNSLLGL